MAKARKVNVLTGLGQFADPHHLTVQGADGTTRTVKFSSAIIAAGSQSVKLPFFPEDERSEEHTSELQSLMRISYAVFCLKKKNQTKTRTHKPNHYHACSTHT